MRMITLAAAGAALLLTGAANAQAPAAPPAGSPPEAPATVPQSPAAAPEIKSVNVVDLDELPAETKDQINQLLATRTADQLERLRKAIDGVPDAKSALEAKGLSSRDILIAQIDDKGELTIVAKKAG